MSAGSNEIRKEYQRGRLSEQEAGRDPFKLFEQWYQIAVAGNLREPNAMTLATCTADGRPSARVVLMKSFDRKGFTFYTNYESRKGRELAQNPQAALVFWWGELERQVRIEGAVEKVSAAESDAYYHSRPLGARLGAWVSRQSSVIANRAVLEKRLAELVAEYADRAPERPPFWGGYRVRPQVIEFWQGGLHRLHDRLCYHRTATGEWQVERLSP